MITRDKAKDLTFKSSKKVAKFYKYVDRKIEKACNRGYTGVSLYRSFGFCEDVLTRLLKPYYNMGYTIIKDYVRTIYDIDVFVSFTIYWA